ncbi:unnamed protein product (macronuclear) [Paramecium tetraurelia]|uniref:C3H1-type domain-containing protein n=1 Tax=Paramecium tetraurelia TaxID=5888 RepID=A0EB04_PARTE|nr:uncharacterized protein GSPATT00025205001 [Paramecium tetraurelia]CAK92471.1 unnamed protein product [Paramecium tetraurelia]|eukprot:XP_001459868.1 hypothetical protein (macronuclear) [Paramecium tetraurelia strain d4-2]
MYADCEDYLSSTSTQDDYGTLNVKLKTEFCKYWTEGKICPYGNKCYFAHGEEQLLSKDVPKNYRTKECKNFQEFFCKYGQRCQFSHMLTKYQMPQLKYWTSVEKIEVGSIKKKHRLKIFKSITSGVYHKQQKQQ